MAAADFGDGPLFLLDYAVRVLRVLILLSLWRIILGTPSADGGQPGGMPLPAVLTYTLIAEVFALQLAARTTLVDAFWQGNLIMRFLRPMGLIRQLSAEMAGKWAPHFVFFSIPLVLVAPLLGVDPRPASLEAGLLFVPALVLAIAVGVAIDVFFGAVTVALEQPVWLLENVRAAIALLLSGSLIPLAFYPWRLGEVFAYLPFAAMAWAPLALYTGTGNPLLLLGTQIFWTVALWLLADWLWRANRERLVSFGG
jgi:ABC-2 type transport system permease protein